MPANQDETTNVPTGFNANADYSTKLTTLSTYQDDKKNDALVSINASVPPKSSGQFLLPKLTESVQTGYRGISVRQNKYESFPLTCCVLGRHLIEKNTAYDWLMMQAAAKKDGIRLDIIVGFRTFETQKSLWIERQNPDVAKKLGVAAPPGFSNHQGGIALDIEVKLTKPQYVAGQTSRELVWLEKYGADFGFDHKEGKSVDEPWHWTHLEPTIKGIYSFERITDYDLLIADTAIAAAAANQSGTLRSVALAAHSATAAVARAVSLTQSTRSDFQSANAVFNANQSVGAANQVSQFQAAAKEEEPQPFKADSLARFSYNFTTGSWGDGKPV